MFSFLSWQIFFAGLWAQVWSLSWPILAIVVLVAAAVFSESIPVIGPFLGKVRVWLFVAAAILGGYVVGEIHGIRITNAKWEARSAIVKKKVDETVKGAPVGDPNWNDPNNSPEN